MKKWSRAWKIELIEKDNPEWSDLSEHIAYDSRFRGNDKLHANDAAGSHPHSNYAFLPFLPAGS